MKTKKNAVKVDRCAELVCPFYHAGHMGHLTCMAADKGLEYGDETPPDWCPLKVSAITVRLR